MHLRVRRHLGRRAEYAGDPHGGIDANVEQGPTGELWLEEARVEIGLRLETERGVHARHLVAYRTR